MNVPIEFAGLAAEKDYRGWVVLSASDTRGIVMYGWKKRVGTITGRVCTRRDNAWRALKRLINDQERGRGDRLAEAHGWYPHPFDVMNPCEGWGLGDLDEEGGA